MLILAGVSINFAINGNLFNQAGNAVSKTNEKVGQTQNRVDELMEELDSVIQSQCSHEWGTWMIIQEATCLVEGKKTRTCNKCEKVETEKIDTIAHTVSGIECATCGIKVGDYINYTPSGTAYSTSYLVSNDYSGYDMEQTAYLQNTKWRILNITENGLELISEDGLYIGNTSDNTTPLYFNGANGYNNAVEILNDMCNKLYGTGEHAVQARSIKIEDIQDKIDTTVWSWEEHENKDVDTGKYGGTCLITYMYRNYPTRWEEEEKAIIDGISIGGNLKESESGKLIKKGETELGTTYKKATTSMTMTQTVWKKSFTSSNFKKQIYYEIFKSKIEKESWVASRAVNAYTSGICLFSIFVTTGDEVNCRYLLWSHSPNRDDTLYGCPIRPIVSLEPSISLEKDNINSTSSITYWNFKSE